MNHKNVKHDSNVLANGQFEAVEQAGSALLAICRQPELRNCRPTPKTSWAHLGCHLPARAYVYIYIHIM